MYKYVKNFDFSKMRNAHSEPYLHLTQVHVSSVVRAMVLHASALKYAMGPKFEPWMRYEHVSRFRDFFLLMLSSAPPPHVAYSAYWISSLAGDIFPLHGSRRCGKIPGQACKPIMEGSLAASHALPTTRCMTPSKSTYTTTPLVPPRASVISFHVLYHDRSVPISSLFHAHPASVEELTFASSLPGGTYLTSRGHPPVSLTY
ncbi:unnamed protein product [Chondrus crispus]|uniref:Uncharacterized protein n=1 Tax=Chondrus crispus TaxID=2769 RepID=R7Q9P1_CHOCR|nr:unnamed protein product [Chondrus crispus]CDF34101.1 unnamed protein product [Chondrus crispus]|eukprot:XP_005713920.1 unnamed protein product [Chondrus crispus]